MTVVSDRVVVDQYVVRDLRQVATLEVARDDPYFFDHPLDHMPGMALVCGLLDMVRRAGIGAPEAPGAWMSLSLEFPAFCELTAPVELEAVPLPGATALRVTQAGKVVCEGSVAFREFVLRGRQGEYTPTAPADPVLVHRQRAENVLIGTPVIAEVSSVDVLRPPAGHRLATGEGAPLRVETLIDATRQFGTLLCHEEFKRSADTTLVLLGLDVDVACGLTGEVRLSRRQTPTPRSRHKDGIDVFADGEVAGRVVFDYFSAKPGVYRRMRGEVPVQ
ncbi:hypothetical protein GCM10023148_28560 [Actinokineospora soli]